jgi:polysaccharide biosynthesis transport protein
MIERSVSPWDATRSGVTAPSAVVRLLHEPEPDDGAGRPHHLKDWFVVLYRYRAMSATIFGVALGLAILVTLLTPYRYTATARLEVAYRSPIQLRLQDSVVRVEDGNPDRDEALTFLATQLAVLRSRDLAERVIRTRRLTEEGILARAGAPLTGVGTELADFLRPRGWEDVPSTAVTDAPPGGTSVPPDLIDRYEKTLAVRDVRGTDLVDVSFTTRSPTLSAVLASAHAQAYMEVNDEERRRTDAVARQFLDAQAAESHQRIVDAEAKLGRFAAAHPRIAANQEEKIGGKRIAELSSRLTTFETERLGLESQYQFLTRPETKMLAYFIDQPGIRKLRLDLLDAQARRASLDQRLGPNHPQMLDLQQVERELRRQIDAEVHQEMAAVQMRYDDARGRENRLRRRLAQEERRAGKLRELGARYELLKGEVETAHALHTSLRKQRMDTAVNAELADTNVRVIDRPEVPERPSRPNVPLNLTIGLVGGLVLAIGGAFARDYFNDTVKSSDEMDDLLKAPTLATIPTFEIAAARERSIPSSSFRSLVASLHGAAPTNGHVNGHDAAGRTPGTDLIVVRDPQSDVAEAFRSMRTAVLLSAPDDPPRVTLVTSALAGEGKTVASLNLALALSQAGARVIVVDADLRHPRAHISLGLSNDIGLSSLLLGQVTLPDVVQTSADPPLVMLPAGPAVANPSELLGSARMGRLLAHLRDDYDFVIVDTPPVLAVTDAVLLAREADGVILVVKGDETPRTLVRRARDRLMLAGARFIGVVVNNVNLEWSDAYEGYARYGYAPHGQHDHPSASPTSAVSEGC